MLLFKNCSKYFLCEWTNQHRWCFKFCFHPFLNHLLLSDFISIAFPSTFLSSFLYICLDKFLFFSLQFVLRLSRHPLFFFFFDRLSSILCFLFCISFKLFFFIFLFLFCLCLPLFKCSLHLSFFLHFDIYFFMRELFEITSATFFISLQVFFQPYRQHSDVLNKIKNALTFHDIWTYFTFVYFFSFNSACPFFIVDLFYVHGMSVFKGIWIWRLRSDTLRQKYLSNANSNSLKVLTTHAPAS